MKARMRLFIGATLALALNAPGTSLAQQSSWWIAPGGGIVWIPNEYGVEPHRPMFGGILGKRVGSATAIELRGVFASSDHEASAPNGGSLDLTHGSANFTWFMFDGAIRPYLTGGAGVMSLSGAAADSLNGANGGNDGSRVAWNGGFGLSIPFSDNIGLRLDGRDVLYKVYVPSEGAEKYKHGPEAFAGLQFGFGGPGKDADQDGVKDKDDKCPGTPFGAKVDATGCPLDSDKDGVPDGIDACDGTPSGATVDARGCPGDEDDDGVLNGLDQCAGTPKGAKVNATGCPTDSDGDTVPDGIDECEHTPPGCTVSPTGCPGDQDQDGVCDGVDKCPDTPVNVKVDATGCPISVSSKETELLETGMIRLHDVNFDTGKSTIKADSYPTLNEVGDILGRWPQLRIEIAGHTDSRGSDALNRSLSDARANAIRDYMLTKFPELKPDQFTAKGYGESQPIASNTTALGRAKNRRVEFRVLNKETLRKESEKRGFAPKE